MMKYTEMKSKQNAISISCPVQPKAAKAQWQHASLQGASVRPGTYAPTSGWSLTWHLAANILRHPKRQGLTLHAWCFMTASTKNHKVLKCLTAAPVQDGRQEIALTPAKYIFYRLKTAVAQWDLFAQVFFSDGFILSCIGERSAKLIWNLHCPSPQKGR